VSERLFETTTTDGVLRVAREGTRWLSTGWRGGTATADAVYSITVPEGWTCDSVDAYVADRLADAGVAPRAGGPVLLTGVAARHCRGARRGPVEAYATAGLSNPAHLPVDPDGAVDAAGEGLPDGSLEAGTVNVVVGTSRALPESALANLVAVASETKAAVLGARAGVPGTTSDAVVAACDPAGEESEFSGSATRVGAAARTCVREALTAALAARYDDGDGPREAVADARYGVTAGDRAATFRP
jgi:adenosylcobinamide hydrolase